MFTKTIYFSGGDFHELQEVFSRIKGVTSTAVGYINTDNEAPSYESVIKGNIQAVMGIKIDYNPKKIDLSTLMDILFTIIDPYSKNKQGECEGQMYQNGVYYCDYEDQPIVELYMNFIASKGKAPAVTRANVTMNDPSGAKAYRRCYVQAVPLENFCLAEEQHQHYLRKNPTTKTFIDFMRLRELDIIMR